jgi:hypothetical protein
LTKNKLAKIYFDVKNHASFGTAKDLAAEANVKLEEAHEFLKTVDAHTFHKPRRVRFKRNRYIIPRIKYLYEADLVDLRHISRQNSGYKFILNCIDVFSKQLWSVPLKDKKGKSVLDAFKKIFAKNNHPKYLQTDLGLEFRNAQVQNYLKNKSVKFITTRNEIKGAVIERLNRTLKTKMFKYFTHKGTNKYIDILQDIVSSYNNKKHSAIGRAPLEVTKETEQEVYDYLYTGKGRYPRLEFEKDKGNIKLHDYVRISRPNTSFSKAYEGTWSMEVFQVCKILQNKERLLYELKDWGGKKLDARFYKEELQQVSVGPRTEFKIHKILRTIGKGSSRKLLVRWSGYGPEFDSIISAQDLIKL